MGQFGPTRLTGPNRPTSPLSSAFCLPAEVSTKASLPRRRIIIFSPQLVSLLFTSPLHKRSHSHQHKPLMQGYKALRYRHKKIRNEPDNSFNRIPDQKHRIPSFGSDARLVVRVLASVFKRITNHEPRKKSTAAITLTEGPQEPLGTQKQTVLSAYNVTVQTKSTEPSTRFPLGNLRFSVKRLKSQCYFVLISRYLSAYNILS